MVSGVNVPLLRHFVSPNYRNYCFTIHAIKGCGERDLLLGTTSFLLFKFVDLRLNGIWMRYFSKSSTRHCMVGHEVFLSCLIPVLICSFVWKRDKRVNTIFRMKYNYGFVLLRLFGMVIFWGSVNPHMLYIAHVFLGLYSLSGPTSYCTI